MTEEISDRDRQTVVRIAEKINYHTGVKMTELNQSRSEPVSTMKVYCGQTKLVFMDEPLF